GLLGMVMAAQRNTPVTRLVINDVGPVIEPVALTRIAGYVGLDPIFDSFAALEAHIREVSAPFGALSDAQWTELARSTARQTADGKWRLKYDPGIAVPFRHATPATTDLWAVWDALHCPTLLLRIAAAVSGDSKSDSAPRSKSVGQCNASQTAQRSVVAGVAWRNGTAMPGSYLSRHFPSAVCRAVERDSSVHCASLNAPNGADTSRMCASSAAKLSNMGSRPT